MKYQQVLQQGRLIKRYKRFLVDVKLEDGTELTMHCPNTGSMKNCCPDGARVWFSSSANPKRKYPNTWEQIETPQGARIGINTHQANALVLEAIQHKSIPELSEYETVEREVPYGAENSRIDFLLKHENASATYIEVKSVTLLEEDGYGYFPDAVSQRAQKHLRELIKEVEAGNQACIFFCVQHTGINQVKPATHIDPEYAALLQLAVQKGVQVLAWGCEMNEREVLLTHPVSVEIV